MTEQLRCINCNDPVTEYADETARLGRCCNNLPNTWGSGGQSRGFRTGLQATPPVTTEDEDEEEETITWACPHCGSDNGVLVTATENHTDVIRPIDGEEEIEVSTEDVSYDETLEIRYECNYCRVQLTTADGLAIS